MGKLWNKLLSTIGDTWVNPHAVAIWPIPAVVIGVAHCKFHWRDYRRFSRHLLPGDMIITRSSPFFGSNAGIRGAFKHLAVYTGVVDGQLNPKTHFIERPISMGVDVAHSGRAPEHVFERSITHAVSEGVVCQDVGDLLFHADYALAVRPWKTRAEQSVIVRTALAQVGKPYDFKFNAKDDNELYCTEVGALCIAKAWIRTPTKVPQKLSLFGKPVEVTLADYYSEYEPVCCSESCLSYEFQEHSDIGGTLNAAITKAWDKARR